METEIKSKDRPSAAATSPAAATSADVCIIDMGQQERSRIRKLRRGEGKLTRQVMEATEALRDEGVLAKDAQIVLVLVRETPSLGALFDNLRGDDEDDDDD